MTFKYKKLVIHEIENGFVLKEIKPENPKAINQPDFVAFYCADVDSLALKIKELLNNV